MSNSSDQNQSAENDSAWEDPRITSYVLDELHEEDRLKFESELQSSESLRGAVEQARRVTSQLEGYFAAEKTPALEATRRDTIVSQASSATLSSAATSDTHASDDTHASSASSAAVSMPSEGNFRAPSWGTPLMVMATAAVLLLLIGVAPFLRQRATLTALDPAKQVERAVSARDDSMAEPESAIHQETAGERSASKLLRAEKADVQNDSVKPEQDQLEIAQSARGGVSLQEMRRRLRDRQNANRKSSIGDESEKVDRAVEIFERGSQQGASRAMTPADIGLPSLPSLDSLGSDIGDDVDTLPDHKSDIDRNSIEKAQQQLMRNLGPLSPQPLESDADNEPGVQFIPDLEQIVIKGSKKRSEQASAAAAGIKARSSMRIKPGQQAEPAPAASAFGGSGLGGSAPVKSAPVKSAQAKSAQAKSAQAKSAQDAPAAIAFKLKSAASKSTIPAPTAPSPPTPMPGPRAMAMDAAPDATASEPALVESASKSDSLNRAKQQQKMQLGLDTEDAESESLEKFSEPQSKKPGKSLLGQVNIAESKIAALDDNIAPGQDKGSGPGNSGDKFAPITDNDFKRVSETPLSTFSVDVDTASYSKVRDYIMRTGSLPRKDAVRIEELVNYFDYDYEPPTDDAKHPFVAHMNVTGCPWTPEHRLARIAIKGKTMNRDQRPPCNLVFLLDTSGSMDQPNKLPLVIEGMKMLADQLSERDKVAIAVYSGAAGIVLESTPANQKKKIRRGLAELSAGGSTAGGEGIALAYQLARDSFISDGVNRVILCTDGDFNVGVTGTDALVQMVEQESKGGIFLSVLGFGMGNHNDAMLEQISGRGNGNYAFIDTQAEAKKVLVDQTSGTLVTIAKDVKLQLEFNPKRVSQYRLIGYENRLLAKEDFNDDKKDAGEIGAGHTVTALYEIVPAGVEPVLSRPKVDELKYQQAGNLSESANTPELLTLKIRYKLPDEDESTKVEFVIQDDDEEFESADADVRFAVAVAGFGMKLRNSKYAGDWTISDVLRTAKNATGDDQYQLRAEFIEIVTKASELMGQQ